MLKNANCNRGVTLIEAIIAVAILSIGVGLAVLVTRMVQAQFRNVQMLEIQRDAEGALYQLVRDIRNARSIVETTSTPYQELTLRTFDLTLPADIGPVVNPNTNILNDVNIATTTYRYVETTGESYLLKRTILKGDLKEERKFLRNLLIPGDPSSPDFRPIFFSEPPHIQVEVTLRLGKGFYKDKPTVFQTIVMPRSRTGN